MADAIFCYGLAFCDTEWAVENFEELTNEQIDKFNYWNNLWGVVDTKEFKEKMEELNILIEYWMFEDCSQLLLAHKDLFITTYDIEIVGKMNIEDSETEELEKALKYLIAKVYEKSGFIIDFKVKPDCILAVNY